MEVKNRENRGKVNKSVLRSRDPFAPADGPDELTDTERRIYRAMMRVSNALEDHKHQIDPAQALRLAVEADEGKMNARIMAREHDLSVVTAEGIQQDLLAIIRLTRETSRE